MSFNLEIHIIVPVSRRPMTYILATVMLISVSVYERLSQVRWVLWIINQIFFNLELVLWRLFVNRATRFEIRGTLVEPVFKHDWSLVNLILPFFGAHDLFEDQFVSLTLIRVKMD